MYVAFDDWVQTVEQEYLQDFITQGGAAVKFVVAPSTHSASGIRHMLESIALRHNCQFAAIDSAVTKMHMIDQIFFEIARQIDWDRLTGNLVITALRESGYETPSDLNDLTYQRLAAFNGTSEPELRRAIRNRLQRVISSDFAMTQEFRLAIVRLAEAQLEASTIDVSEQRAIQDWLRGDLRRIAALKSSLIFQKIARHNARDMLLSLAHWLRLVGKDGMVLIIDMHRYLATKRPADGSLYHTIGSVLDAYEVLRQFVDTTDELEGCFIAVIVPQEFVEPHAKRGLDRYAPLQTRIWNEVQDRRVANPLASLVRITPTNEDAEVRPQW